MSTDLSKLRAEMVMAVNKRKTGLLPPSFSVLEILYALKQSMSTHDRLVLSKGHAALAQYAIDGQLFDFERGDLPGLTMCGSLGHGLSIAAGLAVNKKVGFVFCLIGDGESQEGSIWEAARWIAKMNLSVVAIIDANGTHDGCLTGDLFATLGFNTKEVDGHDTSALIEVFFSIRAPGCIVAHTIKGKGCKLMEQDPAAWHNRIPNDEETKLFVKELINE